MKDKKYYKVSDHCHYKGKFRGTAQRNDDITKENIKECNPNWSQIPDHLYRMLIIWGFGS